MPVSYLLDKMVSLWPHTEVTWAVDSSQQPHEAQLLKLDISKSRERLNWSPRWDLNTALQKVVNWHGAWTSGGDMRKFTEQQINEYEQDILCKY
jgi:CDP-glucose 4,6-dehydratase